MFVFLKSISRQFECRAFGWENRPQDNSDAFLKVLKDCPSCSVLYINITGIFSCTQMTFHFQAGTTFKQGEEFQPGLRAGAGLHEESETFQHNQCLQGHFKIYTETEHGRSPGRCTCLYYVSQSDYESPGEVFVLL